MTYPFEKNSLFIEKIFILGLIKIMIINKRTEEFFLINKQINSAKRFRKFEHISNRENDFIEIVYDCVCKISCKHLHKGSEIKTFR